MLGKTAKVDARCHRPRRARRKNSDMPAGDSMRRLERRGQSWTMFVVDDGTARARVVQLGRRTGLQAQVLDGLAVGERVVQYPSELIADGTPVAER